MSLTSLAAWLLVAQAVDLTKHEIDEAPPFAAGIVYHANLERRKEGLHPLKAHPALMGAAQAHAEDMRAQDYFSHTGKDGSSPSDRARRFGFEHGCGENIYLGPSSDVAAVRGWMRSPGHRGNILGKDYRLMGGGHAGNRYVQKFSGGPEGAIHLILENELQVTKSPLVRAYISATKPLTAMRFRNENGTYGDWQPFKVESEWRVSSGEGRKRVFVQVRDGNGVVSEAVDGIRYKPTGTEPPTRPAPTAAFPALFEERLAPAEVHGDRPRSVWHIGVVVLPAVEVFREGETLVSRLTDVEVRRVVDGLKALQQSVVERTEGRVTLDVRVAAFERTPTTKTLRLDQGPVAQSNALFDLPEVTSIAEGTDAILVLWNDASGAILSSTEPESGGERVRLACGFGQDVTGDAASVHRRLEELWRLVSEHWWRSTGYRAGSGEVPFGPAAWLSGTPTKPAPIKPVQLLSPADDDVNDLPPTLSWIGTGADLYRVQVVDIARPAAPVFEATTAETKLAVPAENLAQGRTYRWSVVAERDGKASVAAEARLFQLLAFAPPKLDRLGVAPVDLPARGGVAAFELTLTSALAVHRVVVQLEDRDGPVAEVALRRVSRDRHGREKWVGSWTAPDNATAQRKAYYAKPAVEISRDRRFEGEARTFYVLRGDIK